MRVHLPLQQGLRPAKCSTCKLCIEVRVHLPLQQGLRLYICLTFVGYYSNSASASSITTRIKTKRTTAVKVQNADVRVHLPLQQGLRQW